MRKYVVIALIFLASCGGKQSTVEHTHQDTDQSSKDSLLNLADEVLVMFAEKENSRKRYIDSIKEQLHHNTNLTANQMQNLRQQIYVHREEIGSYEDKIEMYETKFEVHKDTVIYHFIHETLYQHHVIKDTIYDTVYIEIEVTKPKRKKRKRR